MACEVDLRGAVLDGKRGEFTGKSKPTGNRRGFLSVSDSAPRSRPREKLDAKAQPQEDVDMDRVNGSAEDTGQVCRNHVSSLFAVAQFTLWRAMLFSLSLSLSLSFSFVLAQKKSRSATPTRLLQAYLRAIFSNDLFFFPLLTMVESRTEPLAKARYESCRRFKLWRWPWYSSSTSFTIITMTVSRVLRSPRPFSMDLTKSEKTDQSWEQWAR